MSISLLAPAFLLTFAQPADSPPPEVETVKLSQELSAMLRCSAAFALVSYGQANGEEGAQKWPTIDPQGREFFVRALARIIDETGLDRDQVSQLAQAEAQELIDSELLEEIMPGCLLMLETAGL